MRTVGHVITGLRDGGAEAALYRLCSVTPDISRTFVISLTSAGKYSPLLRSLGVKVYHLNMPRSRITWRGLWRMIEILRTEKPHVVQTWMYHANLIGGVAARIAGCPRVYWGIHHSDLDAATTRPSTRLVAGVGAALSYVLPNAIAICARRAQVAHSARGYANHRFVVIPNGYDVVAFSPSDDARRSVRDELKIEGTTLTIGVVGRWVAEKDHRNFLTALSLIVPKYPTLRALLVGENCTPDNADLSSLLLALNLQNVVMPIGPRNDVPAIMNALDLHVLSSSTEAFPNVIAEAMACGTPCIATDVGDAAVIIRDTGWLASPRNSNALAAALLDALAAMSDVNAWKKRKEMSRQVIVDNYSVDIMAAGYRRMWEREHA